MELQTVFGAELKKHFEGFMNDYIKNNILNREGISANEIPTVPFINNVENTVAQEETIELGTSNLQEFANEIQNSAIILQIPEYVESSTQTEKEDFVLDTAEDILAIPSLELKIVIGKYSIKGTLDNIDRVVVGKEIVSYLLTQNVDRTITSYHFSKLAGLITEVFPQETQGTFYTAAHKNHPAQGKLYSAYINYKTQLRETNLAAKKKRGRPGKGTRPLNNTDDEAEATADESTNTEFDQEQNFEVILQHWKSTFELRRKLIGTLSVQKYLDKYPVLRLANGYELFVLDAATTYGNFTSDLPGISDKIFIYAQRLRSPSLPIRALLAEYERTVDVLEEHSVAGFRQLIALKLLPHVMPNPIKNQSKSEVQKYFIPYFKTAVEEEHFKEDSVIAQREIQLTFIGNLEHPTAYLRVADQNFMIENPLVGFEVLFNTYLSFGENFPRESAHVWHFVSNSIFNIRIKAKLVATVATFISDIEKITV